MADLEPRWLSPEQAAAYIGERVDRLPRLVKAGKLPRPSYQLGPRCARYDRLKLDAAFAGEAASSDIEQAANDVIARIRAGRP